MIEPMPAAVTEFEALPTTIAGLLTVRTKHVDDERGRVAELYRKSALGSVASAMRTVGQVNLTTSRLGTIRGLHGEEMTKLVGIVSGRGFGAYLDARPSSPTFGSVVTMELGPGTQVLVPSGVCNGFQSLTDGALYLYCFDAEWAPSMPGLGVNALDPDLAIDWPIRIENTDRSLLSEKDAGLPNFSELGLARDLLN